MDAFLQALFLVLVVGGFSLLAHWGWKNRTAEIGLIVILLFGSFLVVVLGGLVALAGRSDASPISALPTELSVSSGIVVALAGFAGLALCVPPLRKVIGEHHTTSTGYDTANPNAESFATAGRFSDPILFALWMFVMVFSSNVVILLAFTLTPDAVDHTLTSMGRLSPATIVLSQLPFVVIALLGVGLGVRRNLRETLVRLGYGTVTLPQIGIAALFVAGAFLLSSLADALFAALQPDLFERVGEVTEGLFSPEGLSPVSAILFALLVGAGAGFGEETLFRGAVQPALGITPTSVLFASMHVQYGPSLLLGYLFIISVGLGLLRKHINTTASFLAHAGYNTLGVLLAYFFGV